MARGNRELQAWIEQLEQELGHDGWQREAVPPCALTGCRLLEAGVPPPQANRPQTGLLAYLWHAERRHILSVPFITSLPFPLPCWTCPSACTSWSVFLCTALRAFGGVIFLSMTAAGWLI